MPQGQDRRSGLRVEWEQRTSFFLLWRGSALSVTAAVGLALVGTDFGKTPYISLHTLHSGESLKTEDNNMHGGLFMKEIACHMGGRACKILKHCCRHSCLMVLIAFFPEPDSFKARTSHINSHTHTTV